MRPIPWGYVGSWNCVACGLCCKYYDVILAFPEWINILRSYGVGVTESSINKLSLKRRSDGSCVFLCKFFDKWLCGLQNMKPLACKLWPFKILNSPKFGRGRESSYTYRNRKLFVYVDPSCVGIQWGVPTQRFTSNTIAEFVEIAMGLQKKQYYSTSKIPYDPLYVRVRGRRVI